MSAHSGRNWASEPTYEPDSVSPRGSRGGGDHPSRATIAGRLKQLPSDLAGRLHIRQPLPKRQRLLPCSRWGLPGRLCHHRRRCALTAPFHPYPDTRAVCSLLHFPAGCPGLPLTTTVPCGVRTFLDPCLPTCVAVQDAAITRPTHSHRHCTLPVRISWKSSGSERRH